MINGVARLATWFLVSLMLAALMCIVFTGCSGPAPSGTASQAAVEHIVDRGPVTLTVRFNPARIAAGESGTLTIEVVSEPGIDVVMPVIGEQLGDFEVVDSSTPPDVPADGKRRWTHHHTLRTLETGSLEIPAVSLMFTDNRATTQSGTPDEAVELASPPLAVNVQTALAGEFDPAEFRDIKDAVDVRLPGDHGAAWWVAVIAVVMASAAWIGWHWWRKGKSQSAAPMVALPPHEWAMRQLDALAQEQLPSNGQMHAFYTRLTGIAREFIERRFGIMASEQTTEEFLWAARASNSLDDQQRRSLADFLRSADLVKFARFEPTIVDADEALELARAFVRQTMKVQPAGSIDTTLSEVNSRGARA